MRYFNNQAIDEVETSGEKYTQLQNDFSMSFSPSIKIQKAESLKRLRLSPQLVRIIYMQLRCFDANKCNLNPKLISCFYGKKKKRGGKCKSI